jgi:hypothetical protein
MKKNLISEINKIKNIINLLESTDVDCEKQLEKSGYIVYNPEEQGKLGTKCKDKPLIKCVINVLSDIVSSDKIYVQTTGSMCYVELKSTEKVTLEGDTWNKIYLNFWEDGDFTYVETLDESFPIEDTNLKTIQFMYQGDYECDTEKKEIKIKNMRYRGYMTSKDPKKVIDREFIIDGENYANFFSKGTTYDITDII